MSPTPFHRKGPWKKTSSGQLSKTECGDGQAGAEQQKATPRQENKQCAFFLSFFSFSLFYLRKKKKVLDTASHEHAAEPGAAHCKQNSQQPERTGSPALQAAQSHGNLRSPDCAQCPKQLCRATVAWGGLWRCPVQVGSPSPELCPVLVNASTAADTGPPPPLAVPLLGMAGLGALGKQTREKEPLCNYPNCCQAGTVLSEGAWLKAGDWHWQQPLCSCLPCLQEKSLCQNRLTDEQLVSNCQGAAPSWDSKGGSRVCPQHPHGSGAPVWAS